MGYFIMISQFLLSLSLLVVLHELGHFLPAKWFKTKVEKFYLFFDPWVSLVKKKIGETEYGIGWLPLGGYVKIAGMVDESFDTASLSKEAQPWEFRSKPAWQRLIIMLGGVTVNFLLGFFIFAMMIWLLGSSYIPTQELKNGILVDSLTYKMGFRDGDIILKMGDKNLDRFDRSVLVKGMVLEDQRKFTVRRGGQMVDILVDPVLVQELTKPSAKGLTLWTIPMSSIVKEVIKGSAASKAGMQAGDLILSLDQKPTPYIHQVQSVLAGRKNVQLPIQLVRGTDTITYDLNIGEDGRIGVYWTPMDKQYKIGREKFSFFQSIPLGVKEGIDLISNQLKAFGKMFSGEIKAKDSLGGFASIAGMFEKTWDWESFWRMTAILSIILGFMNLLPIPGLDGGHVVFLLVEVVTGRKVPDSIVEKATMVGFILLLGLLLFANGMDLFRIFGKG
ncbi:MAG: RIP metalloprotease RseP [Saprospiraceae bacterium]|jgi:regulator of sigma E protease|nr:RIP metalloprotease RseP [Saprospiraceae bacterium]MBK7796944.1 RIP metalloprotease RseP [Saprospiraceae bacterium]MBL0259664.1 RIP metalloprotease RseP [Saprospiraceae bacterium]